MFLNFIVLIISVYISAVFLVKGMCHLNLFCFPLARKSQVCDCKFSSRKTSEGYIMSFYNLFPNVSQRIFFSSHYWPKTYNKHNGYVDFSNIFMLISFLKDWKKRCTCTRRGSKNIWCIKIVAWWIIFCQVVSANNIQKTGLNINLREINFCVWYFWLIILRIRKKDIHVFIWGIWINRCNYDILGRHFKLHILNYVLKFCFDPSGNNECVWNHYHMALIFSPCGCATNIYSKISCNVVSLLWRFLSIFLY